MKGVSVVPKWITAMPLRGYRICKDCEQPKMTYARRRGSERCRQCWEVRGK